MLIEKSTPNSIVMMTADEARIKTEQIKQNLYSTRQLLLEMYEREGWRALEYSSWREYGQEEFGYSETRVYELMDAARVQRNISEISEKENEHRVIPDSQLRPLASLEPEQQREAWALAHEKAKNGNNKVTAEIVKEAADEIATHREPQIIREYQSATWITLTEWLKRDGGIAWSKRGNKTFNETNENIEWAMWSWNPVTGCKFGCEYCYARDIANRFYPHKFEPTFHPDRLTAPQNNAMPRPRWDGDIGYKGVFVCSMADLFGPWVPQEWIDATLEAVRQAPQWNFLFLTKNPSRMVGINWPQNAWAGTTVDVQKRVPVAEEAFTDVRAPVKFISCEPMRERLVFNKIDVFDWVIIGGQSKTTQMQESQPEWEWVESVLAQARQAGCMVYFKTNLSVRPREYPV